MSQKNRNPKKPGKPPGLPKSGGRKKGIRNKGNLRLREKFAREGFDFVKEVIETLQEITLPEARMDALLKLTPFFMQRLRQEEEAKAGALGDLSPEDDSEISTAELVKIVEKL